MNDEIRHNYVDFSAYLTQARIEWKDGLLSGPFLAKREGISLRRNGVNFGVALGFTLAQTLNPNEQISPKLD